MEYIFEFLFELIFEGSLALSADKKVPMIFRILAGTVVFAVLGGIIGICFREGIRCTQPVLILLGAAIFLLVLFWLYKQFKGKRKNR